MLQNATLSFVLNYEDADGRPLRMASQPITIPYKNACQGAIPVPQGSAQGTEVDVPMVGLPTGATLVLIENQTGQELNAAWGGNWMPHLGVGGVELYVNPTVPQAGDITQLRFMLTGAQVADGAINFWAFGS